MSTVLNHLNTNTNTGDAIPFQPPSQPTTLVSGGGTDAAALVDNTTVSGTDYKVYVQYAGYVLLFGLLCYLLYTAYKKFVSNSEAEEPATKPEPSTRDGLIIDFNLRESIKKLQDTQKKITSTLSEISPR